MIQIWTDDWGKQYAHGVARVILSKDRQHPRFFHGRHTICSFSAETERINAGKDENGKIIYKNALLNFTAFGKIAFLCRNFENGDRFAFYGRYEVDDYWTKQNGTGEVQYKITLEWVGPQLTEEFFVNPGEGGDSDGSGDDIPPSYYEDFYGGPNY